MITSLTKSDGQLDFERTWALTQAPHPVSCVFFGICVLYLNRLILIVFLHGESVTTATFDEQVMSVLVVGTMLVAAAVMSPLRLPVSPSRLELRRVSSAG